MEFCALSGRPRGTVGKASASEARSRGPGFEPPWLVQRSRWESRPLSLVGNGAGAVTHPIDRKGSVFPRGTGRFLVIKGVHIASFRCLSEEITSFFCRRTARALDVRFFDMCVFVCIRECVRVRGVCVAQWAKRPPLKQEIPGSNPRGCFNGHAGNRDPLRWLETAWGMSSIRLIEWAQYFPGELGASS